ncbi:hypothetical protein [Enterobacter asburiae]|uniref:hypothetical protein n=1 Tax=Enterobacter asburiae TaxID=61645 RepID=UPI00210B28A7|nr:hypothetical protein [Enterobacter asburiae]MCQ4369218.1 hypothetical protein [Enterobacter asburiae]HDC4619792.1 hypothetical protein [Enterobacter asburiae]
MNRLTTLYIKARAGLSPYEKTPEASLIKMAKKCGRNEIAAINIRLKQFHSELAMVEEWDGDQQDMIWDAIDEHCKLLQLITDKQPT